MIVALLLTTAQPQVLAVLEFRDKVAAEQRIDAAFLSDQVRSAAKELLPQVKVITRENMLVLLQSSGKDLATCEGECEVDTARRIGADLVISGELLKFGTQYKLNMKLHDTRSGELISGAVASGATADELDAALRPAVQKLVAPLGPMRREEPPPAAEPPSGVGPAFSAHASAGFGTVNGNVALVSLPFGSTQTGSAGAPSFGAGLDVGAHLGKVFTLAAYGDYVAIPTDTFVHLLTYGVLLRARLAQALSVAGGAGFSRLATSVSGPSFTGEFDYTFSPPFAFHLQAIYAHEANSDGLFNGENTVFFLGAGVSVTY